MTEQSASTSAESSATAAGISKQPPSGPLPDAEAIRWLRGTTAFGLFLIAIGLFALFCARDIRQQSLAVHDPGPRALPLICGWLMLVGGIVQVATALFRSRQHRLRWKFEQPLRELCPSRTIWTLMALVLYLLLLPWVGYSLATVLFLGITLKLFGSGWGETVVVTVVLVSLISILFERLFQVTLPQGSLFF